MCSIQMHNKHPSPWHTHSMIACGETHLSMCLCDTGMILKGHCFAKKILWHQCTADIAEGFPSLSLSLKPSFLPRKEFQTEEGSWLWKMLAASPCLSPNVMTGSLPMQPPFLPSSPDLAWLSGSLFGEPSHLPLLSLMLLWLMSNIIWIFYILESVYCQFIL